MIHKNKTPKITNLLEKRLILIAYYFCVILAGFRDLDFLNSKTTLVLNEVCEKDLRQESYNFAKKSRLNWSI